MKNILRLCASLMFLSFISCNGGTFSPIVEVNLPPHTPRLVIRADWSSGSDSLSIFVSKSRGVLDTTPTSFNQIDTFWNGKDTVKYVTEYYDTVANAKVELLRNGQLVGLIPYFKKGYHYAKGLFKLDTISGTIYTVRVSAPGFETIEASQTIQNKFIILRGGYKANGAVYTDPFDPFSSPEKGDELTVELQDNGSDENYYTLESVNYVRFGGNNIFISRDSAGKTYTAQSNLRYIDPLMEDNFLPDRTFNGKNYVWRFWLRPSVYFYNPNGSGFSRKLKSGDKVQMRIHSASKSNVLFIKTLDLAYNAQDNPFFTEPVILHSNVKNGYGIFTIGSVQTVTFVLP